MPRIHQLSPHEAQKIAAGEVVERPANVVKELVENSLDAQATSISIYIEQAGKKAIRIVDNGHGMDTEDAQRCFDHHATSKIASVHDLNTLLTFGFRGEALSSIAAVSAVTLITKEASASEGTKVHIEGSQRTHISSVACGTGTDITIENLFYNVPARKKFLKSDDTEWRQILLLFQAFCLDYLSVHFSLYHNDSLIHNCPPAQDLETRVLQLWDVGIRSSLIPVQCINKDLHIHGAITNQQYARYDRSQIFFFVNKRWVKNGSLAKYLIKGYLNVLPHDRFPAAFIFIELPTSEVDINIHPRKEEVQFLHPRRVETCVQEMVKSALEKNLSQLLVKTETTPHFNFDTSPFKESSFTTFAQHAPVPFETSALYSSTTHLDAMATTTATIPDIQLSVPLTQTSHAIAQNQQTSPSTYMILGQLHLTYILIEQDDGLFIVDQHAAHERVLYERFGKRFEHTATNQLVFPALITLSSHHIKMITPYLALLGAYGIMLEPFNDHQLVLQATPVHAKDISYEELIIDIISWIQESDDVPSQQLQEALDKKIRAQMACKAAVKAGDVLLPIQMEQLLKDLAVTHNRFTCPHGRPTGWLLSYYDLEKKFKRKL